MLESSAPHPQLELASFAADFEFTRAQAVKAVKLGSVEQFMATFPILTIIL